MKKIILALAAIAIMANCSKESLETSGTWNGELLISSGITTRASGTTWESGDEIGVFMSNAGTTTAVGTHNTKYTTTSTLEKATFTVDSKFTDLYYPQSGSVDIVAHYPYDEDATVSSYPVDVTDQTDLTEIDFMSTKMEGVAKSSTALNLEFYHLLSQLNITLTPATDGGLTADQLATATVMVSGTQVKATATVGYDNTAKAPTATFSLSGDATDLTLTATSGVATFIIVPQKADVTFTITVADVGEFFVTAEDLELASGNEHNYTISVSRTAVKIEGATINTWGTEGTGGELDASDYITPDIELVDEVYYINSAVGLQAFADLVNGEENDAAAVEGDITFGSTKADINVVLSSDVDLENVVWTPIGDSEHPFTGSFDGAGYEISGLYINQSLASCQGFFGYTDGATIQNIGVSGSVTGDGYVGGVVGYNSNSSVINCYSAVAVEESTSYASVAEYNSSYSGVNRYNTATIEDSNSYIGGVVGYNENSTVINCYNTMSITGSSSYVGGVVGYNFSGSVVTGCYNAAAVEGSDIVGGVVARNGSDSTVSNCYYNSTLFSGDAIGTEDDGSISTNVVAMTSEEMLAESFVLTLNNNASKYNTENTTAVQTCAWIAVLYGYPMLDFDGTPSYTWDESDLSFDGLGTEDEPYQISTASDLRKLSAAVAAGETYAGKYFMMTKDIDLGGDTNEFTAIGDSSTSFQGTFDGGNFEVSGLYSTTGLFGKVKNVTIKNISVSGNVTGDGYIGGVVSTVYSSASASIINCYNKCELNGASNTGGVIGYAYISSNSSLYVTNCHNSGKVSGSSNVGGVVGTFSFSYSATIYATNCYNTGEVDGSSTYTGGVVGRFYYNTSNYFSTITSISLTNSYNTGKVSGTSYVGGVVGIAGASASYIYYCYNAGVVSGSSHSVGGVVGSSSGKVANCYNSGAVEGDYSYEVGGIAGYSSTISNCYSYGSVSTAIADTTLGGVVGSNSNSITNCYYNTSSVDNGDNDSSTYTPTTAVGQKEDSNYESVSGLLTYEMTSSTFVTTLGDAFTEDSSTEPINSYYPILTWQSTSNE